MIAKKCVKHVKNNNKLFYNTHVCKYFGRERVRFIRLQSPTDNAGTHFTRTGELLLRGAERARPPWTGGPMGEGGVRRAAMIFFFFL